MGNNLEEFKKIAGELGYDPQQVESFTSSLQNVKEQMPDVPAFQNMGVNMGSGSNDVVKGFMGMANDGGKDAGSLADLANYQYGGSVFGAVPQLSQVYGNKSHMYDNISGGVNRGADFAVPVGTPLFAPEGGEWKVLDTYTGAQGRGMQNTGWGNSVILQNPNTKETIRMSHLSQVGVKPGQVITGGAPIALSGDTGHATGPHVDTEYTDAQGNLRNILESSYANQFYGQSR